MICRVEMMLTVEGVIESELRTLLAPDLTLKTVLVHSPHRWTVFCDVDAADPDGACQKVAGIVKKKCGELYAGDVEKIEATPTGEV